jgi:hypothetical protein
MAVTCFNCRQKGCLAKQCPKPRMSRANQAQNEDQLGWNDHNSEIGYLTLTVNMEQSTVSQLRDQLKALTLEQKSKLANENEIRVLEDFPST